MADAQIISAPFVEVNPGDTFTSEDKTSIAYHREMLCVQSHMIGIEEQQVFGVSEGLRGAVSFIHGRYGPSVAILQKGIGQLTEQQQYLADKLTLSGEYRKEYIKDVKEIFKKHQITMSKDLNGQKRVVDLMVTLVGENAMLLSLTESLMQKKYEYDGSYRKPAGAVLLTRLLMNGIRLELDEMVRDAQGIVHADSIQHDIQRYLDDLLNQDKWRS